MPFTTTCLERPNCYYKQLKRKEQECEEYKTQLKQVKYLYEVQDEKLIDELTTENKKYNQTLDDIENIIKELSTENILTFLNKRIEK